MRKMKTVVTLKCGKRQCALLNENLNFFQLSGSYEAAKKDSRCLEITKSPSYGFNGHLWIIRMELQGIK